MLSLLRLNSSSEIWQVDEITVAADWWSVGALLYELITGQVRVTYLLNYCLLKYLKLLESSKSAMDKSPWDSNAILIFSVILGSLIKKCILFEIFLQFSLPLPYTS